ncbi:MAG: DNA-3-methyladenine glycosylase 2 family protein [Dehalococcoidia bacterium]|nr:DNA-3-methyladenine glycosylase 2 family protein [Dehalococcoidia bacterium]
MLLESMTRHANTVMREAMTVESLEISALSTAAITHGDGVRCGNGRRREEDISSTVIEIRSVAPYDFALSLNAMLSRQPGQRAPETRLRIPSMLDGSPAVIEVTSNESEPGVQAFSRPDSDAENVRTLVEWVLFAGLNLTPFYLLANRDTRLRPIIKRLHGLKPMRPASLFEMAVIAITEQQVSLASAHHVRDRLIRRFGQPVEDLWVFPEPGALAEASIEALRSVGLTRQKADYIHNLSLRVASGELNLDALKSMSDAEAKATIVGLRGFGAWSADYVLLRGLARPDSVPTGDVAIRDVVGKYLGDGLRTSSAGVEELLEPFRPYRGLLAFYLLVYRRLERVDGMKTDQSLSGHVT